MIPYKQYITVSGTGDKQTGLSIFTKYLNFKASMDAQNILRGFFTFIQFERIARKSGQKLLLRHYDDIAARVDTSNYRYHKSNPRRLSSQFIFLDIRGGGKGRRKGSRYKAAIDAIMLLKGLEIVSCRVTIRVTNRFKAAVNRMLTASRQIPALVIKISRFKKSFRDSLRVDKRIESFKKYKQGLRRANREKAKHLISSNLEREGDNLTASADHNVVAHMLKSIAEKNCFYFTCYISSLTKGLVMGQSPFTPSRYK